MSLREIFINRTRGLSLACWGAAAVIIAVAVSCTENQTPKAAAASEVAAKQNFFKELSRAKVQYSGNLNQQDQTIAAGAPASSPGTSAAGAGNSSLSSAGSTGSPGSSTAGTLHGMPNVAPPTPAAEAGVKIPADAKWTLFCAAAAGPERFVQLAQFKDELAAKTRLKEFYIIHGEQQSTLFYGFYSSIERNDRAGQRAHADRKTLTEWADAQGNRPLAHSFFTPIQPPDPAAPAQWNLASAPRQAYWSLQIAAFKDDPRRKEAAVEAVKELRQQGIEAYYYHGSTISSVCVGSWPASAVKEQDVDSGTAVDPDDAILVTNAPLPSKYRNAKMKNSEGQRVRAFSQRIEIVDAGLLATMKEFPHHYVNYKAMSRKVRTADGSMKEVVSPSFLVIIARDETGAITNSDSWGPVRTGEGGPGPREPDPASSFERPAKPQVPSGAGKLRGLE